MRFLSARPLLDNPVDAELFVDREEELSRLRRAVSAQFNSLISGVHGSGKTSLLRHLAWSLRQDGTPASFINGSPARSVEELLDVLRERLFGVEMVQVPLVAD